MRTNQPHCRRSPPYPPSDSYQDPALRHKPQKSRPKMSDDDFMLESDQEDYEFDYETEGEDESQDVDVENRYYNAKQMKQNDPQGAIEEFLSVVSLEKEKGDWCVLEIEDRA